MKKIFLLACMMVSALANAQFISGQVLTAAQLNSVFATKAPIPTGTCLGSGFALNYNLGSNTFSCNGAIGAVTLNGNTFQSPGPIGSVSPSTGSFTNLSANGTLTFANGSITLPYLATQSANTVVANTTAGSASPTAVSVPSCSTSASAISYTSGTGFGCNSAVNAAQLGGATFASPTAIGSTTPSTGAFTTLSSTGNFTPSQTNGIVGTTTNNNANAGSVGEYVSNTTASTAMPTVTPTNCTSVSLTAGDWNVSGTVGFTPSAAPTNILAGIGTVSATLPGSAQYQQIQASFGSGAIQNLATPSVRISLSATTTVFLIGYSSFASGTMSCSGAINARRVR